MLPFLNVFGVAIAFPPLIVIIGIWLGASLVEKHAYRQKIDGNLMFNLIFITLAAYLIGGRLSYAIQHVSAFSSNWFNLFSRNSGLFDTAGGLMAAVLAALIYGQRKKLAFWPTLDALTPALAVLMVALHLANFASGEAFGAPSDLPWAVHLWGMQRHPVQLYEAVGAALVLRLMWPGKTGTHPFPGSIFLQLAIFTVLARLFFEAFRGGSVVISPYHLRLAQVIAWLALAAILRLYVSRWKTQGVSNVPKG